MILYVLKENHRIGQLRPHIKYRQNLLERCLRRDGVLGFIPQGVFFPGQLYLNRHRSGNRRRQIALCQQGSCTGQDPLKQRCFSPDFIEVTAVVFGQYVIGHLRFGHISAGVRQPQQSAVQTLLGGVGI